MKTCIMLFKIEAVGTHDIKVWSPSSLKLDSSDLDAKK
jgi:hypothetical protein